MAGLQLRRAHQARQGEPGRLLAQGREPFGVRESSAPGRDCPGDRRGLGGCARADPGATFGPWPAATAAYLLSCRPAAVAWVGFVLRVFALWYIRIKRQLFASNAFCGQDTRVVLSFNGLAVLALGLMPGPS